MRLLQTTFGVRLALLIRTLVLILAGMFAAAPARAGAPMTFRIVAVGSDARCGTACPLMIAAEGEIGLDTPQAFLAFLKANVDQPNLLAIVAISSEGGRVIAAIELGTIMRRLGMAAVVERAVDLGNGRTRFAGTGCYSACAYMLMGGKRRVVPRESEVGIHRMFAYAADGAVGGPVDARGRRYDDGTTGSLLLRYSRLMGVSGAMIQTAERTSPDTVHLVTAAELKRWRLASRKL